jgi:uncharacterized membrane protein YwzB
MGPDFLIWLIVLVFILAVAWWVIRSVPMPPLWRNIIVAVVALVLLIWLLNILGVLGGHAFYHTGPRY